jgi:hypothetical protein
MQQLPVDFEKLSGTGKINAILDLPDTSSFVQTLAPDSLYLLMRDIGVEDCLELLPLTTQEQRRAFIDLDAWRGAELDTVELDSWLSTLSIAGGEQLVVDTVAELDPELLVDYLLQHAIIVLDRTEEDEIEAYEKHYIHLRTPDQDFVIVLPPTEGDEVSRVRRMVEALYRGGLKRARDLMFACKTGLRLENEELAFRFRIGRLADLGFPSRDESWALFAPIDEKALRHAINEEEISTTTIGDEDAHLGLIMTRSLDRSSFLATCIEGIEDSERFVREYAALVNRAVVAEPGEFVLRDLDRLTHIATTTRETVSLGLEILSDGSVERGKSLIAKTWLIQLHQLGHRATVQRALKAKELQGLGGTLFPDNISRTLSNLRLVPRPRYTADDGTANTFASIANLHSTDLVLNRAESMARTFDQAFGINAAKFHSTEFPGLSEDDRSFVTYETLAHSLLANMLVHGDVAIAALSPEAVLTAAKNADKLSAVAKDLSKDIEHSGDVLNAAARSLQDALSSVSNLDDVNRMRTTLLITAG